LLVSKLRAQTPSRGLINVVTQFCFQFFNTPFIFGDTINFTTATTTTAVTTPVTTTGVTSPVTYDYTVNGVEAVSGSSTVDGGVFRVDSTFNGLTYRDVIYAGDTYVAYMPQITIKNTGSVLKARLKAC